MNYVACAKREHVLLVINYALKFDDIAILDLKKRLNNTDFTKCVYRSPEIMIQGLIFFANSAKVHEESIVDI